MTMTLAILMAIGVGVITVNLTIILYMGKYFFKILSDNSWQNFIKIINEEV